MFALPFEIWSFHPHWFHRSSQWNTANLAPKIYHTTRGKWLVSFRNAGFINKIVQFFFLSPQDAPSSWLCHLLQSFVSKLQLSSPIRGKCRGSSPKNMKYGWYDLHRGWLIDVNSVFHSNPLNPLSSEMEHPRSERQSFRIPESHWKA